MASTKSVCDLLKGKGNDTDVNRLQKIQTPTPSLSPDSPKEQLIKQDTDILHTYIKHLESDIIPDYNEYTNSYPFLPKIKEIIKRLLEYKKMTLPTVINNDIVYLFNNNKNDVNIKILHTGYINAIKKIWNKKTYDFYEKIYKIYKFILLIEQTIKKKQLSLSVSGKKGEFNKKQSKNNQKTIKKKIKKTLKNTIKKTIKKKN